MISAHGQIQLTFLNLFIYSCIWISILR